jgi:hypothetical protein
MYVVGMKVLVQWILHCVLYNTDMQTLFQFTPATVIVFMEVVTKEKVHDYLL